ncbi:hypothetical protein J2847_003599 [Azospirillum agricola]|uniref:DUF2975 domain-containing protein n=1 Tax=Azospirillum agricola TaxID=1720247 RepID=UPI001AE9F642|nr:DUF2975 domain-containing protein [Azospirillum agricola]MBP2230296.1 hypothetical protein [Azospirillum agricola]
MSHSLRQKRQARIARVSRRLAGLMTALLVLTPAGLALYAFAFSDAMLTGHPWLAALRLPARSLSALDSALATAALLVAALPGLWGLWELRALFRGFAAGLVFSPTSARRLRRFAASLMVSGLGEPVGSVLLSMAVLRSVPDGGGPRGSLSLSTGDLSVVLLGMVLLVIAWVMGEAAALADENAGFV